MSPNALLPLFIGGRVSVGATPNTASCLKRKHEFLFKFVSNCLIPKIVGW